jgi:hypothetical protein
MRPTASAVIALSIALSAACAHARDGMLRVNAYDDRLAERHLEEARADQRRTDAHREEAHREDAHREEAHLEDERLEEERLAEARREARIQAYDAWLERRRDMQSRDGMTP